jgi:hypothetical protein
MAEIPGQSRPAVTALTVQQRAGALVSDAVARYQGMDGARRSRLLVAAALVVGCFLGLMWYTSRPDWRTLYAGPGHGRCAADGAAADHGGDSV